jgi:hypothetical protein
MMLVQITKAVLLSRTAFVSLTAATSAGACRWGNFGHHMLQPLAGKKQTGAPLWWPVCQGVAGAGNVLNNLVERKQISALLPINIF